jgi:hypothetical protein
VRREVAAGIKTAEVEQATRRKPVLQRIQNDLMLALEITVKAGRPAGGAGAPPSAGLKLVIAGVAAHFLAISLYALPTG